jgi:hypothetical protein
VDKKARRDSPITYRAEATPLPEMTASVRDHELSAAILSSIREGSFPDSEDVLTAELPATALPTILGEVSDARQQLEVRQCIKNAEP